MGSDIQTTAASGVKIQPNLFIRFWRGEISLAVTFWIFGVAAGVILRAFSVALAYVEAKYAAAEAVSATTWTEHAADLYRLIYLVYFAVVLVAAWRSAARHAAQKPGSRGWAHAAQFVVCLQVLVLAVLVFHWLHPGTKAEMVARIDKMTQIDRAAIVAGLNADLPRKLDNLTTLMQVELDHSTFIFHFRLTSAIANMDKFNQVLHAKLIESTCQKTRTRNYLEQGMKYNYVYADWGQNVLADITVSKADCPDHR